MDINRFVGVIIRIFACICLVAASTTAIAGDLNVIGHRGAAGLLPENTLAGFKKAMELGVDTIELDIRITADNEAVVYHDSRLNPAITRGRNGKWVKKKHLIKELSLLEVQAYDVGKLNRWSNYSRRYPGQKPGGFPPGTTKTVGPVCCQARAQFYAGDQRTPRHCPAGGIRENS